MISQPSIRLADQHSEIPRWISIARSRWWYLVPAIHIPVAWWQQFTLHSLLEILILSVGIAIYFIPSTLYPHAPIGRYWRIMAFSWIMLICRQIYLIFDPQPPGWLDLLLIFVYGPSFAVGLKTFYALPFERRSRRSMGLDCIAIFIGVTIISQHVLAAPVGDVIYLGGNAMMFFAIYTTYRQHNQAWRNVFSAMSWAIAFVMAADVFWVLLKINNAPLIYAGPAYSLIWLVFSRSALIIPLDTVIYDRDAMPREPLLSALAGKFLLCCSLIILAYQGRSPVIILILFLFFSYLMIVDRADGEELTDRLAEARTKDAEARKVIGMFNHEVGGEINGTLSLVEILVDTPVDESTSMTLYVIRDSLRKVETILQELKVLTNTGELSNQYMKQIHLEQFVRETVAATPIPPKVEVSVQIPHGILLYAEELLLGRALDTMIRNSIQAINQGESSGYIIIEGWLQGHTVYIRVSDSGVGFSPSLLWQIKRHLEQHTSIPIGAYSTKPEGSGKGLPLIQHVANVHQGIVDIGNRTDSPGAWIEVRLPYDPIQHPGYRTNAERAA